MNPTREQIGRTLYECEKKRGEHADAVMKGISPKASDALLMEPWEECKDSFLADADAVLGLFRSAASIVEPVALTREEALQESQYLAGLKAGWNFGITEQHELFDRAVKSREGHLAGLKAAAPTTSPNPVVAWNCIYPTRGHITLRKEEAEQAARDGADVRELVYGHMLNASPEPDAVREAAIEECAKVLDEAAQDWNRIRDPGMANNARSYAKKIRALAALSRPAHGGWEKIDTRPEDGPDTYPIQVCGGGIRGTSVAWHYADEVIENASHWAPMLMPISRNDRGTSQPDTDGGAK